MSDYNLIEAQKWFISTAAFLARDMCFDAHSNKPIRIRAQRALEQRIDRWRGSTMQIIQQHQRAHVEIKSTRERIEKLEAQVVELKAENVALRENRDKYEHNWIAAVDRNADLKARIAGMGDKK